MQVQTGTKTSKKVKKEFNLGDTVTWASHANGWAKRKTGSVIAVMKPGVSYRHFSHLPKGLYEKVLRAAGWTRDGARDRIARLKYNDFYTGVFRGLYKLKFSSEEGMNRDTYHYLIEVDPDPGRGNIKRLYHPKTHLLEKA